MKKISNLCYCLIIAGFTLISLGLVIGDDTVSAAKSGVNKNLVTSVNMVTTKEDNNQKEDVDLEEMLSTNLNITPASFVVVKNYDEMTVEEKETGMNEGSLELKYSEVYSNSGEGLSVSKGAMYFNGHKETYYSEKVLPGTTLDIPGRHVADDGTIRDGDGYICVAADPSFLPKGSVVLTSLGPAKVYDSGCAYGIVDLYVSW